MALLSIKLGFPISVLSDSLPVMVKGYNAKQRQAKNDILHDSAFLGSIYDMSASDFAVYATAQIRFHEWRSACSQGLVQRLEQELIAGQDLWRQTHHLDRSNPVVCPLNKSLEARLPVLDWNGSKYGLERAGQGFRYCV